jgi:hypothetical protein
MNFMISRPQKKKKAQPGAEAGFAAACAIGFYVSLDAQKRIFKKLGFGAFLRDPHYKGGPTILDQILKLSTTTMAKWCSGLPMAL